VKVIVPAGVSFGSVVSYLLAGLIPQAKVKIYPDAAHGFLFQHHTEFAADVEAFLSAPR
jgi:pimeloyl-ACP methyl ester carboxylesterase